MGKRFPPGGAWVWSEPRLYSLASELPSSLEITWRVVLLLARQVSWKRESYNPIATRPEGALRQAEGHDTSVP